MAAAPKPEARRAIRRNVNLECAVFAEFWGEPIIHQVTDISEDGVWIPTDLPLGIGTEVTLSFQPSDWREPLYVAGCIRRVELQRRAEDPRAAGMGISFEALRADERRRLTRSLLRLRPRESYHLGQRTLTGVPVGHTRDRDRRTARSRTMIGWAAPTFATEPKQERRSHTSPSEAQQEPASHNAFGGGVALIASVLADVGTE